MAPINIVRKSTSHRKAKPRMVPLRPRTEAIGFCDYLGENFNSILPLKIFTYQKGISNPPYVPNIGIGIDTGNSEWTSEFRPRMYYQEFSHNAMHAHAACTHWSRARTN